MVSAQLVNKFKSLDFTDYFTIISYLLILVGWLWGFDRLANPEHGIKSVIMLLTLNSIHGYFNFWMVERSPKFKELTERAAGTTNMLKKLVILICITTIAMFLLRFFAFDLTFILFLHVFWNSWHVVMQTKGLYYISRLNDIEKNNIKGKIFDLKMLNYFLLFLMSAKAFSLLQVRFRTLLPDYMLFKIAPFKIILFWTLAAYFVYMIYVVIREKNLSLKSAFIFSRFGLPILAVHFPLAIYGTSGLHGLEYYDIARKVEKKSQINNNKKFVFGFIAVIFLQSVINLYDGFVGFLETTLYGQFFLSLGFATITSHFVFDSFAFKLKDPEVRKEMVKLLS